MSRFNFKDGNDFEKVKEEAEKFYSSVGSVYCSYFKEKIAFNSKGIKHLRFKSDKVARTREDQYSRLKLVRYAPQILSLSRTVQGIWHTKKIENQKTHNRWERVLKLVSFYEFIAVLDDVRVKVIVKQVEGGEKHFWSIIPFWKIHKETRGRLLYSGNPDHD
ncbi:MAG: hypothetical protein KBC48_03060 [Candidatus Pacebacteria bacterium]|nr:hypothetical protein [Candidatus Paceibacterota bacterium]